MKIIKILLTLAILTQVVFAKSSYEMKHFGQIPILNEGRIKPLDTFARVTLLAIHEKSKTKEQSASQWLAELLFSPDKAFNRKIFRIRNKDVIKAINIEFNPKHLYSFIELSSSIRVMEKSYGEISKVAPKERTPVQKQIFSLYTKILYYYELSRSLSLLDPQFNVPTKDFAKELKLPFGKKLTYLEVLRRKPRFKKLATKVFSKDQEKLSRDERQLLDLGRRLEAISSDSQSRVFRIIPPQFEKSTDKEWTSPWQTIMQGLGTPLTVNLFKSWTQLHEAYRSKDLDFWEEKSLEVLNRSVKMSEGLKTKKSLTWEYRYNTWDLFTISAALYIFAFLLLSLSWLIRGKKIEVASFYTLVLGAISHTSGLIIRCYVMSRPPVSTLYESIVFVSVIAVIAAIFLEIRQKNTNGTLIGTALGAILLFVSFSYEKDGDSMGMLAAVLDTNFWLATHVVTITIGYGCCFVSSLLGHIYLIKKFFPNHFCKNDLTTTYKNIWGTTLFALFFTVLGTILGGIWADQSWGRFWGWDPKENGAMLICMWLLWVIHGELAKYFSKVSFAIVSALSSVIVVFAWFGVNLLNVGLHSYGFTDSIANNITYFTIAEVLFCLVAFIIIKTKTPHSSKAEQA